MTRQHSPPPPHSVRGSLSHLRACLVYVWLSRLCVDKSQGAPLQCIAVGTGCCVCITLFLFDFVASAVQFVPDRRGNFPDGQHSSRVHIIVCSNPSLPCAGTALHPAMIAAETYLGKTKCGEVNGLAQRFLLALDRVIPRASLA